MAALTNLLAVEDDIVAQLETVAGFNKIYREPLTDGLRSNTVITPSIWVASAGVVPGQSAARASSQKLVSLWTVAVLCDKVDYMTVAGPKMIEIIKILNGLKSPDWAGYLQLAQAEDKNRPVFDDGVAYYPVNFSVDIVI